MSGMELRSRRVERPRRNEEPQEGETAERTGTSRQSGRSSKTSGSRAAIQQREKELEDFRREEELNRLKGEIEIERKENRLRQIEAERQLAQKEIELGQLKEQASSQASVGSMISRQQEEARLRAWVEETKGWREDDAFAGGDGSPDRQRRHQVLPIRLEDLKCLVSRKHVEQELPAFDGNPAQWPMFLAMYRKSTENGKYSDDENLLRLQKALRGKAKEYVGSLLYLPGGLPRVIERLSRKFGRPDVVVTDVMSKLNSLVAMKENSLRGIEKLASEIDNVVSTIVLVDRTEYLFNPILLNKLVNMLNVPLKLQWGDRATKFRGHPISLRDFNDWLQEKVMAIGFLSEINEEIETNLQERPTNPNPPTDASRPARSCVVCQGNDHCQVEKCPKFVKMDKETRFKVATASKLCFLCLKRGHRSFLCRASTTCGKCQGRHHVLMHPNTLTLPRLMAEKQHANVAAQHEEETADQGEYPESSHEEEATNAVNLSLTNEVLLQIAPVKLVGPKKTVLTYALLDNGSTVTMIEKELADELGVTGVEKPLKVRWTDSTTREETDSREVKVQIAKQGENAKEFSIYNARTVANLNLPVQTIDIDNLAGQWSHLKGLEVTPYKNAKPRILIGEDNRPLSIPLKVVYGPWRGPVASKTRLGWVIHGNAPVNPRGRRVDEEHHQLTHWMKNEDETLTEIVERYIAHNSPGKGDKDMREDNEMPQNIFKETTPEERERKGEKIPLGRPNNSRPHSRPVAGRQPYSTAKATDENLALGKHLEGTKHEGKDQGNGEPQRGTPDVIHLDNGTNFKKVRNQPQQAFEKLGTGELAGSLGAHSGPPESEMCLAKQYRGSSLPRHRWPGPDRGRKNSTRDTEEIGHHALQTDRRPLDKHDRATSNPATDPGGGANVGGNSN